MEEKYTELRAALASTEFWNNGNGERFSVDTDSWGDAANPNTISALLAERDAFADVLEAIASIKATPGRAKADALLASVVNLASAAGIGRK